MNQRVAGIPYRHCALEQDTIVGLSGTVLVVNVLQDALDSRQPLSFKGLKTYAEIHTFKYCEMFKKTESELTNLWLHS